MGRRTFATMCSDLKKRAARTLFEKARSANAVAKMASLRGRRMAYDLKHRCLAAAIRLEPFLFRMRSDLECRRYVVSGPFGALHWKRLDEVG